MDAKLRTNTSSALPARPERPFRYVCPVTIPDGSLEYDDPPENYFDTSVAPRLLPSQPPSSLYDTVARAHDHRFQVSQDALDPDATTPRPLRLSQPERPRPLAKLCGDSIDYMGISPDLPEWRPRRSSYEDRRGAVGVTPSHVNALKPPIDTSMSSASDEWLGANAKRLLADLCVVLETSQPNTTVDITDRQPSLTKEDSFTFDHDTQSECDAPVTPHGPAQPTQEAAQVEESISHSEMDTDNDTDTDTDMSSDDGRDWDRTRLVSNPQALRWLIPRRRRSVETVESKDIATDVSPPSSDDEHTGKPHRSGAKTAPFHQHTTRYANDTPTRHPSDAHTKPYPCLLDGCSQMCASSGDLHRHQQSLRHRAPSHPCLSCGKSYTRSDALKRHFRTRPPCKRVHATKMSSNGDENQGQMETNEGAA